jgi:hypothetical protein
MKWYRVSNTGYIWDKRIFWGAQLIIVLLAVAILWANHFDLSYHPYLSCNQDICENPFYKSNLLYDYSGPIINKFLPSVGDFNCDFCDKQFLPRGEYGVNFSNLIYAFIIFVIAVVLLAIFVNHKMHNVGKTVDIGAEQYDGIRKFFERFED